MNIELSLFGMIGWIGLFAFLFFRYFKKQKSPTIPEDIYRQKNFPEGKLILELVDDYYQLQFYRYTDQIGKCLIGEIIGKESFTNYRAAIKAFTMRSKSVEPWTLSYLLEE